MQVKFLIGPCLAAATATTACSKPPPAPPPSPPAQEAATLMVGSRPSLTVEAATYDVGAFPNIPTTLAEDPRRDTVVALCTPCHSARYITAQPPLSEEIWQAEIKKMIEGFGATIPEEKRADILGYLTDHYGPNRALTPTKPAAAPPPPGMKMYCVACHGAEGRGVPAAFPPLAGHAAQLGQTRAGREYLIDVVLHGVAGPIQVDGTSYNNMMPPLASRLNDAQVAAVINEVRKDWPQPGVELVPITEGEVAARRTPEKSPQEVHKGRPQ